MQLKSIVNLYSSKTMVIDKRYPQKNHLFTALLMIYNADYKFLMQIRSDDAPIKPSVIGYFGGGIKDFEDPYEAAIRESLEELSIKLDYRFYKKRVAIVENKYYEIAHFFIAKINNKQKFVVNEGDGHLWLDVNNIPNDIAIQEHDLNILNDAYNILIK